MQGRGEDLWASGQAGRKIDSKACLRPFFRGMGDTPPGIFEIFELPWWLFWLPKSLWWLNCPGGSGVDRRGPEGTKTRL